MAPVQSAETVARLFGCTPEQVRAQWARVATSTRADAARAVSTGRKVRGYSAAQLAAHVEQAERGARS